MRAGRGLLVAVVGPSKKRFPFPRNVMAAASIRNACSRVIALGPGQVRRTATAVSAYATSFTRRLISLLPMFALLLGCSFVARADELVQVAPHRAAVWPAKTDNAPPLLGFLARPYGPGRVPAVVLLHWCTGYSDHDTQAAAMLKSWGCVALAVDSLGDANMCTASGGSTAEMSDAYAALRYLAAQDFVAADRIAVMGYSIGASESLRGHGGASQRYRHHASGTGRRARDTGGLSRRDARVRRAVSAASISRAFH